MPQEADFLRRFDAFRKDLDLIVDMPNQFSNLLFRILHENEGVLSRRKLKWVFAVMTDDEISHIEIINRGAFADYR